MPPIRTKIRPLNAKLLASSRRVSYRARSINTNASQCPFVGENDCMMREALEGIGRVWPWRGRRKIDGNDVCRPALPWHERYLRAKA